MVKVSITLPNNAQIVFEAEDPDIVREIVGMVLRDLPRELMQATPSPPPAATSPQNGTLDHPPRLESGDSKADASPDAAAQEPPTPATGAPNGLPPSLRPGEGEPSRKGAPSGPEEQAFVEFCRSANPVGDMRRVLVAAEGARRFLGVDSVDTEELGRLFALVGWQRPHSFVQTLRNAARRKFRWLERVPGRAGRYTVTDVGRAVLVDG